MAGPVFDRISFAVWYIYICIGLEFKGWLAVEGSLLKCFSTEMKSLNRRPSFPGKTLGKQRVRRTDEKEDCSAVCQFFLEKKPLII